MEEIQSATEVARPIPLPCALKQAHICGLRCVHLMQIA